MDQSELDHFRALLDRAIALTAANESLDSLAGTGTEGPEIVAALAPLASEGVFISWLAANAHRVDAVVVADHGQWRVVFASSDRERIDWVSVVARPARFAGVEGGRLVVCNGPSGAGKSTLMRAIQALADDPWVVFDEPENLGSVDPGYLIWREQAPLLHEGYLDAIASLAKAGNYAALAAAGHDQAELRRRFAGIPTTWVGLFCERATLIEREQRADRWGGIADGSRAAHDGWTYDLTLDTTVDPDVTSFAAEVIRAAKRQSPQL